MATIKAFPGWRRNAARAKRKRVADARQRVERSCMSRTFFTWRYERHLADEHTRLLRKVSTLVTILFRGPYVHVRGKHAGLH